MSSRILTLTALAILLPLAPAHADFSQTPSFSQTPAIPSTAWPKASLETDKVYNFLDSLSGARDIHKSVRPGLPREAATTSRDAPYQAPALRQFKNRPEDKPINETNKFFGGQNIQGSKPGLPRETSDTTRK